MKPVLLFNQMLEINIYTRRKSFLFNMNSSDEEVKVVTAIALSGLENKSKNRKRTLRMKQSLQGMSQLEVLNTLLQ